MRARFRFFDGRYSPAAGSGRFTADIADASRAAAEAKHDIALKEAEFIGYRAIPLSLLFQLHWTRRLRWAMNASSGRHFGALRSSR